MVEIPRYHPPADEEPRVLIVDDDPNIIDLVSLVVESMGYPFDIAEDGAQALQHIEQRAYGIVLMDLQMPVMSGFEAVAQVRENPRHRDTFVVAVTARALCDDGECLDEAGFDAYVAKPIAFDELELIIERRLGPPGGGRKQ